MAYNQHVQRRPLAGGDWITVYRYLGNTREACLKALRWRKLCERREPGFDWRNVRVEEA